MSVQIAEKWGGLQGLGEKIALQLLDAHFLQESGGRFGFDAFGHNADAEGPGQLNDSLDNSAAFAVGNPLDDASFAGCITPLEDDDHFEALMPHPELEFHEFNVQLCQFLFEWFALEARTHAGSSRPHQDLSAFKRFATSCV